MPDPAFQCDPHLAAPQVLARRDEPSGISADASALYWFEDGWLVSAPKHGGKVRRIAEVDTPTSRAVPGGPWLYVTHRLCDCLPGDSLCECLDFSSEVLRIPKRGRGAPAVIAPVSCEHCDVPIALRRSTVYFLVPGRSLMRVSVYGGKPHQVAEVDGYGLLLVGGSAVVAPATRVDLRTGAVTKLSYPGPPLASDGHELFGSCGDSLCALVPGKKVRRLGPLPLSVDAIATDARYVYVADSSEEIERVRAFPKHGGAPVTLQCGNGSIESMVADRSGLYLVHPGIDTDAIERVVFRPQAAHARHHSAGSPRTPTSATLAD